MDAFAELDLDHLRRIWRAAEPGWGRVEREGALWVYWARVAREGVAFEVDELEAAIDTCASTVGSALGELARHDAVPVAALARLRDRAERALAGCPSGAWGCAQLRARAWLQGLHRAAAVDVDEAAGILLVKGGGWAVFEAVARLPLDDARELVARARTAEVFTKRQRREIGAALAAREAADRGDPE